MKTTAFHFGLMFASLALVTGCGRGNGLPAAIASHLAAKGIAIRVERTHAPLSSRGGYLVTRHDPKTATEIISAFKLDQMEKNDRRWGLAVKAAGGITTATEAWGLSGRPPQFQLKGGGQFEYFFLVITSDGWMYLAAEYAYG